MALNGVKLASELAKMTLYESDAAAAKAWADAWFEYLVDVTGAEISAAKPVLMRLKPVMLSAMMGMSAPGVGPKKIQDGIAAVWGAMIPATSSIFTGTVPPLTPPPGINSVASAIGGIAPANTAPGITREQAYSNIANAIHPLMVAGGTVTVPPSTGPIL